MPTYNYAAMDASGREQRGRIEADSEELAFVKLKERGLYPTHVSELTDVKGTNYSGRERQKRGTGLIIGTPKIKSKELMIFTRQLATLLHAGLPLVRALRTLEGQSDDLCVKHVIGDCADSIEGGLKLSDALSYHPKTFSRFYINMVRAGEASGAMDRVLARLAEYLEKSAKLKAKVLTALIYPAVVLTVAFGITVFLLVFIVPEFTKIFSELLANAPLPKITVFVVTCSNILADPVRLLLLAGFIGLLITFYKVIRRTGTGLYLTDMVYYRTPPFGKLIMKASVARFCSTLATLMDSGVNILNALQIARDTAGNEVVKRAIQDIHDAVKEGEGMAKPLATSKVFPKMVVSMIEVGEETGQLPDMMARVADVYEMEVDMAVDGLTSLIEPLMIVILGVLIGGIVLAMFLPLIEIINQMAR